MQDKSANTTERLILIGGGVGPMAGVELHRRVIEQTATDGTDQDHLEVFHISRSPIIGDRTDFLFGKNVPDPVEGMLRVFRMAAAALDTEAQRAVAGIPCNTFHAPAIFEPFTCQLKKEGLPIRLLHMLEETVERICFIIPNIQRVGLLSTTGTRRSGIYQRIFSSRKIKILEIPEEHQAELHEVIYNRNWGIKAAYPTTAEAVCRVEKFGKMLENAGAEAIILGCTELPLAVAEGTYRSVPYIDPMTALARALIRETAPEKLSTDRLHPSNQITS